MHAVLMVPAGLALPGSTLVRLDDQPASGPQPPARALSLLQAETECPYKLLYILLTAARYMAVQCKTA